MGEFMSSTKVSCVVIPTNNNDKLALCTSTEPNKAVDAQSMRKEALAALKGQGMAPGDVYALIESKGANQNAINFTKPTEKEVLQKGLSKPKAKYLNILMHSFKKMKAST